jgi:hypothetical protein
VAEGSVEQPGPSGRRSCGAQMNTTAGTLITVVVLLAVMVRFDGLFD